MKKNYQKIMEKEIEKNQKRNCRPKLLLHSCCAPCSTYVITYLDQYFDVTVYFFNPNIYPETEYSKRLNEQIKLVREMDLNHEVAVIGTDHQSEKFYEVAKMYENEHEGGERCLKCFELRLKEVALYASKKQFDYFTTTLSISPLKNAEALNNLGVALGIHHDIQYLQSDFKKKEGFKKSILLSNQYDLYRQNYCGCVYSKTEIEEKNHEQH